MTEPPAPIRIGLAVNLSGRGGTAGEYVREGTMLAVQEVNRRGGVGGRPLALVIRDDKGTPEGVVRADRELLESGVRVIVGHVTSEATLVAHEFFQGRDVLLFTPFTATTRLSGLDDMLFRTCVDNAAYGRGMSRLLQQKGAQRVGVLLDNSNASFTEDYVAQTRRHFPGSLVPVAFDPKQPHALDEALQQLLATDSDALVLLTEVSRTGIAAQKLRAAGYAGPLIATLWAQTPDLPRYGGAAAEGMSLLTFIAAEYDNPLFRHFAALVQERLKRPPNARSIRAYEAITILTEGLRASPSGAPADLKRALSEIRFQTLMGEVRFDRFGDVQRPLYEIQVRDGRLVTAQVLE
jgi:branched-chain amino acid transport system substrate-binding protein